MKFARLFLLILLTGCMLALPDYTEAQSLKLKQKDGMLEFATPKREKGQTDVLQLRCDPIPVVRVAFIGLGMRGSMAVDRFTHLDGVEVVALCDVRPEYVQQAQNRLKNPLRSNPCRNNSDRSVCTLV